MLKAQLPALPVHVRRMAVRTSAWVWHGSLSSMARKDPLVPSMQRMRPWSGVVVCVVVCVVVTVVVGVDAGLSHLANGLKRGQGILGQYI